MYLGTAFAQNPIMKFTYSLLLAFCFCFTVVAQSKFPNDWKLMGLKDNPKQMTQTTSYIFYGKDTHKNRKALTTFTFNRKGHIVKHKIDSLGKDNGLNTLKDLTYTFTGKNKREIADNSTNDIVRTQEFRSGQNDTQVLVTKSTITKKFTEKTTTTQIYTADFKHLETNENVNYSSDVLDMNIIMNQIYSYNDEERIGLKVTSTQKTNSNMFGESTMPSNTLYFTYGNYKYDEKGNYTYREMYDKLERVALIEERKFIYK